MSGHGARLSLIAVFLCSALPVTGLAKGNPEAGRQKSQVCQTCHGVDGNSVDPIYPDLAGQYESYLVKALTDYRSGKRTNAIMASFARELSNQDIEDLSAWYASQEGLIDLSIK